MIDMNIKKLGFGMMRLPRKNDEIDIEKTKDMVDAYMNAGFTYFDTAFVYEGSEEAVRKALVERYPRESFQLATKNASWSNCKTRDEAISQFDISLERTGAKYFDFYLLHNLGDNRTKITEDFDLWNWGLQLKKKGLIKYLGFSFHSTADELDEILSNHPEADFVQLQINYLDWESNSIQSRACYEVARKHNTPIIVMEPVKAGMLAKPSKYIEELLKKAEPNSSPASWAIRFAAGLDGVLTVLSGMSSMEQVQDNISYMADFNKLTDSQKEVLDEVQKKLNELPIIPCTSCDYCAKVCPKNIGISGSFSAYNLLVQCESLKDAKGRQEWTVDCQNKLRATECIKCGKCEEVCPQRISIRKELEKVIEALN